MRFGLYIVVLAFLAVSCVTARNMTLVEDDIYYVPGKKTLSELHSDNSPMSNTTTQAEEVLANQESLQESTGYWMGGFKGNERDLEEIQRIINLYPQGFAFSNVNGFEIALNLSFDSDWNVYTANGRYWWFPSNSNIELYSSLLFGTYPKHIWTIIWDSPRINSWNFNWGINWGWRGPGWSIGFGWNYGWYDPWYHPWYGHHPHRPYPPYHRPIGGHPNWGGGIHKPGYQRPGIGIRPNSSVRPNIGNPIQGVRPGTSSNRPGTTVRPSNTTRPTNNAAVKPTTTTRPSSTTRPGSATRPGTHTQPNINAPKPGSTTRPGTTTTRPGSVTRPGSTTRPNSTAQPNTTTRPKNTTRPGNTTRPSSNNRQSENKTPNYTRPSYEPSDWYYNSGSSVNGMSGNRNNNRQSAPVQNNRGNNSSRRR